MKVGDKVRCKYNKFGIVTGFISPTDVLVDVTESVKSMKGRKVVTNEVTEVHYYTIDQLEVIE